MVAEVTVVPITTSEGDHAAINDYTVGQRLIPARLVHPQNYRLGRRALSWPTVCMTVPLSKLPLCPKVFASLRAVDPSLAMLGHNYDSIKGQRYSLPTDRANLEVWQAGWWRTRG